MRSTAESIHISAVKHPTQKLFWPWFLPILAGSSYPAIAIGLLEHLNPEYHFEEEILVPSYAALRRLPAPNEEETKLSVFPNPAKTHINITYHTFNPNEIIQIADATGKVVLKKSISGKLGDCLMDVQNLKSGLYLVQLRQNNVILISERLIIAH